MAIKNRNDLKAFSLSKLPDNNLKLITPADHREVNDEIIDSFYNKAEDSVLASVNHGDGFTGDGSIGTPLSYDFAALPVAADNNGEVIILHNGAYKRINLNSVVSSSSTRFIDYNDSSGVVNFNG